MENEGQTSIIITQEEYDDLIRSQMKLQALENAGVDNWDWYGDAMEEYENMLEDSGL